MKPKKLVRREFIGLSTLGVLGLSSGARIFANELIAPSPRELLLYVGTYTSGKSEGIYVYKFDLSSGEFKHLATAKGIVDPSFLAIDPRRRHLYAVNEIDEFGGKPGGAVSAFKVDLQTGNLQFLNQQPSLGGAPCYVTVDKLGKFVLVANYGSGNAAVLPINDSGLGKPVDMVQHGGSSVDPERQKGPHAHNVILDKTNRHAFVTDLGLDKIMIYRFDGSNGKLTPNGAPWVKLKPGAGPRHFTFHPNGRWAYVINELDSTLTAFSYESGSGSLKEMQTVSTLPTGFSAGNSCADVHVSPSGKFLYGSNRGHDSIVVFSINPGTGKLTFVEHVSTGGKTPRNFTIDPTGAFLLAANQKSDNVVSFRIDATSGRLRPTGHVAEIPTPVCLVLSDKL
jgi:6-phosphogluconolactonase